MVETNEVNEVKIGTKPLQSYLYAVLRSSNVLIKARGTNMKLGIDTSLVASRDYGYEIDDVKIYNSSYTDENQRERKVSNIEIELSK